METTNKLLRDIDVKYKRTQTDFDFMRNYTETLLKQNIEEKLTSKISNLETNYQNMCKSLKSDMAREDNDIRQSIAMRSEDYNMIRKTTNSRLSVYEARLDTLEHLVFEVKQMIQNINSPTQQYTTAAPKQETSTNLYKEMLKRVGIKTDISQYEEEQTQNNDYEEFAGNDFSMLGLSNPEDLDTLDFQCLFPPCDKPGKKLKTNRYQKVTDEENSRYFI